MSLVAGHRAVVSGTAHGPLAALARAGLTPLSWAYGLAIAARNVAYDTAWIRAHRPPRPSIAAGNVTAGGTGKTPFIHALVGEALKRGLRPAVISRGYRGSPDLGGTNDETRMLELAFPGVIHVERADRLEGARRAASRGADVLLFDDALQHRRLLPHLMVGLVDATCPFGFGRLLPRGLLREPLRAALERVDLVLLTRTDQVAAARLDEIHARLQAVSSDLPVVHSIHAPLHVRVEDAARGTGAPPASLPPSCLQGETVLLFSGIANPAAFESTVRGLGARIVGHEVRPDHTPHSLGDVHAVQARARKLDARWVLTTRKDRVRIPKGGDAGDPPLAVLDVALRWTRGAEVLHEFLDRVFPASRRLPPEG